MILSNVEIHRALDDGRLVISPEPTPRLPSIASPECPYKTSAVDLRLWNLIVAPGRGYFAIDHLQAAEFADHLARNSTRHEISSKTPYKLEPGEFVLGSTLEVVSLPIVPEDRGPCLAARIEGKSSRARTGLLIHVSAPTVHNGFSGRLTLEMCNLGTSPILLAPNMYIAQLIVEEVKGVPVDNVSRFQGQVTPEGLHAHDPGRSDGRR